MIRPFTLADLGLLLRIEHQSFPKSPYDSITFFNLHLRYPEGFLVYEGKLGEIWGYIVFSPDGHIISLAVHPLRRREGVATELFRRALESLHVKRVWAEVRRSNLGAQAFYIHTGFQVVGEVAGYYQDEDALIVEKRID